MHDDQELITIAEFLNDTDAHLARIALEEAGVRACVMGDLLMSVSPKVGMPKVELKVTVSDVEKAKQVLAVDK